MIHKLALVHEKAKIAPDVEIGPWTFIDANVEIGSGSVIASHVVIKGPTKLGKNNKVYQFASLGEVPQDKKFHGENSCLEIGDNNIFRESCTVHRGTEQGGGVTRIGDDNLFMAYSHIAHDCVIGNKVVFSNNASIAGHVVVEDHASLGGLVGVHQFCIIGAHSFAAGGAIIYKDVPPFVTVSGYPAKASGLNSVGLERRGYSPETINALRQAYKIVFRKSFTVKEAISELEILAADHPQVRIMIEFLLKSTRGIIR
ncbi:MAG: acyl-ACP--UDP-N-acetylglucosamine O-acyltransferase [Gammaproteobacteria bacterium]